MKTMKKIIYLVLFTLIFTSCIEKNIEDIDNNIVLTYQKPGVVDSVNLYEDYKILLNNTQFTERQYEKFTKTMYVKLDKPTTIYGITFSYFFEGLEDPTSVGSMTFSEHKRLDIKLYFKQNNEWMEIYKWQTFSTGINNYWDRFTQKTEFEETTDEIKLEISGYINGNNYGKNKWVDIWFYFFDLGFLM